MIPATFFRIFALGAILPLLGSALTGCHHPGSQSLEPVAKPGQAIDWKARQETVREHARRCMQGLETADFQAGRTDCILMEDEGAFPIAGNQLSQRGWRFPVAGSETGNRRAIAIGLGFETIEANNPAMVKLVGNSLRWLGTGLKSPVVGLVGDEGKELPAMLLPFKVKPVKSSELDSCDILVVNANALKDDRLAAVEAWSRGGKARLLCLGRTLETAAAFPGNRVIQSFGLAFGGGNGAGACKCPGADWSLLQLPAWALAVMTADDATRDALSAEELNQLGLGISQLQLSVRNSPEKMKALAMRILPIVNRSRDGKINTAKDPWLNLGASLFCELARRLPPEALPVPACVKTFPGLVESKERLGSTQVEIDLAVPRWHSTGVYAAPGEVVTITLPKELAETGNFGIQIGCHTDNVRPRAPALDRFPMITRYYRVTGPVMQVACAFGGPVYIDVRKPGSGKTTVTLAGGAAMPIYRTGDSLESWKKLRTAPAPWAEFQGKHLIITVPATVARTLENPDEILAFWDKVVEVQDGFIGYTKRTSPERFVYDRQISVGWMHSGYPLMAFDKVAKDMFDLKKLHEGGNWGCFHELGHNHQSLFGAYENAWTFDGNIEVTVNLFSAYTYIKALGGETKTAHSYWNSANLDKNLEKEYKPGIVYANGSHSYRSLFFAHLAAEFGWETLGKCLTSYWDLKPDEQPQDNLAKRSLFLVRMSRTAGYNLTSFFKAWGLETTETARQQVASLPAYTAYKHPFPVRKTVSAKAETEAIIEAIRFDIEAAGVSRDSHYASIDKNDAQRLYAGLLERAPLENTPPRFAAAYLAHAKAWRENNEAAIDATWEILSQEAAAHGICLEALEMDLMQ